MAGRYYVTGVQLGILKAFVETDCRVPNKGEVRELLNSVEDNQFIGSIESKNQEVAIVGPAEGEEHKATEFREFLGEKLVGDDFSKRKRGGWKRKIG